MDPITLALLGIASGGLGIAQPFIESTANNPVQRMNRGKLDELLARKASGQLGIDEEDEDLLRSAFSDPIAAAATSARQRAEQVQAAGGASTGAEIAQLRQEQVGAQAGAARNAALQIAGLNREAKARQEREIEQRVGLKAGLRSDDMTKVFDGLGEVVAAAAAAAGVPGGGAGGAGLSEKGMAALGQLMGGAGGAAATPAAAAAAPVSPAGGIGISALPPETLARLPPQLQSRLSEYAVTNEDEFEQLVRDAQLRALGIDPGAT